jgi:hypothetical protein
MKKIIFIAILVLSITVLNAFDPDDISINVTEESVLIVESCQIDVVTSEILSSWNITSFQFKLEYDETLVEYLSYSLEQTISTGGMIVVNDNDPGILQISYMNTTPLSGEGSLVSFHFDSIDTGTTDLVISNFKYNAENIQNLNNGQIIVELPTVETPEYSPDSSIIYTNPIDVVISTPTDGATIMYRAATDGGAWTDWETYTDVITVPLDTEMDFEAYAQKDDWVTSQTVSANYIVTGTVADPTFSPAPGIYTEATDVSIETATEDATIMYRTATDGGTWTDWEIYTDPITVPLDTEMDFEAYAEKDDWVTSQTVSANYIVTGTVADPTFSPEPGLYTEATDVSIETDTEEATIMYRTATNCGAWSDWETYTVPITVPLDTEMDFESYAQKDDWVTSQTVSANYIVTGTVADPTFSPAPGLYTEATDVSIETDTEEATIMYRTATDGGAWSNWETYTVPITVPLDTEMDFESYAQKDDWVTSETVSANYIVTGTVADPTFSPAPGLYTEATDVSIETATEDATLMYRTATDGGAWTNWETYTDPITVPLDTEMDFEANAEKDDWVTSQTVSANYIVTGTVADPTFSPEPGLYTEATDVSIETDTEEATIMYRTATNGGAWSDWETYTDAITVELNMEMDFEAYAEKDDWVTSQTVSANYIVTGTVADPTFSPAPGLYTEATDVIIETDTEDATIMYRTAIDGGAWTDWETYIDAITVPLDTEMDFEAYAEKDDWVTSQTVSANYVVTGAVADPTFSPAPGLYTEATDVSIETDTEDATIMYRTATDGSAWTNWETYTEVITVPLDTEMDFEAYAEKDDWVTSQTVSANYVVTGTVATPTNDPPAGAYTEPIYITLDCDTEGADIYYTLDGEEPTQSSELYTEPIYMEYSHTLKAKAFKDDWIASETLSAEYHILYPPTNLEADAGYIYVELSWGMPELPVRTRSFDHHNRTKMTTDESREDFLGYNIYRYDEIINDEIITVEEYEDTEVISGETYLYYVTAVYSEGESDPSNEVEVTIPEMVATPEFDPDGGFYEEAIEVVISTSTPEADIYYTLDESEPTQESFLYTEPVYLDSTTTIKAKAFKEDWEPSEVAEAYYEIEITGSDDDDIIPLATKLDPAYPNPFNPSTTIPFSLKKAQDVNISIFNIRGQKIKELIDGQYEAGNHQVIWHGKDHRGERASSGVYFCIMRSEEGKYFNKIVMIK